MARSNHPIEGKASEPFVQRGKTLIVSRQYQEAVKACRLGLLARPTCVEGRVVLSMALMALGRVDEVLAEIRVALDVEPDNPVALLLKGEALYKKERPREAYVALARAAELDPENEKVIGLLETVAEQIDDVEQLVDISGHGLRGITTKVYPSQRAQQEPLRPAARPSLAVGPERPPAVDATAGDDLEVEDTDREDLPAGPTDPSREPVRPVPRLGKEEVPERTDARSRLAALQRDALHPGLTAGYRETQLASSDDEDDDTFTTAPFLAPSTDLAAAGGGWGALMTDIDPPTHGEDDEGIDAPLSISSPGTFTARDPVEDEGSWSEEMSPADGDDSLMTAPERDFMARELEEEASLVTKTGQEDNFNDDTVDQSLVTLKGGTFEFEPQLEAEGSLITRTVADDQFTSEEEATQTTADEQQRDASWRLTAREAVEPEEAPDGYQPPSTEALFGDAERAAAAVAAGEVDGAAHPKAALWDDAPPRNPGDPTSAMKVEAAAEEEVLSLAGMLSGPGTISAPTARDEALGEEAPSIETKSDVIELSRVSVIADLSEVPSDRLPAAMPPLPAESGESALPPSEPEGIADLEEEEEGEEDDEATRVRFDAPGEEPDDVIFAQSPPLKTVESDVPAPDPVGFGLDDAAGAHYPEQEPFIGAPQEEDERGYYEEERFEGDFARSLDQFDQRGDYREPAHHERQLDPEFAVELDPGEEAFDFEATNDPYGGREAEAPEHLADGLGEGLDVSQDSVPTVGYRGPAAPAAAPAADDYPPMPAPREPTEHFGAELDERHDDASHDEMFKRQWSEPVPRGGDSLLAKMAGASNYESDVESVAPARIDEYVPDQYAKRERTSFLTLLLGDRGSNRWLLLLLGSVGVLGLAVGVGLLVRHLRVSDEIETKREGALSRLERGNLADFEAARQVFATILGSREDDAEARWIQARISRAIPFEFGDPIPQEELPQANQTGIGDVAAENLWAVKVLGKLSDGQLNQAVQLAFKARRDFPDSALLHYLDGRIHLLLGQAGAATKYLKRANKLNPKDVLTLSALGMALAADGRTEEALRVFRRAKALNLDHIGSLLNRSAVLLSQRRSLSLVEESLRSVIQGKRRGLASRGQRGWAYLLFGRLEWIRGDFDSAGAYLRQARNNEPANDPTFLDALSDLLLDLYKIGEAENAALRSEKLMPTRPHPKCNLAQIYLRHGRPRDALQALKRASGFQVSSLLKARIHLRLGEVALARREVDAELKRMPGLEAKVVEAEVLAAEGKGDEAEALLRPLLEKHQDSAQLLTALGKIYLKRGDPAARDKFEQALKVDRHAFEARLLLADAYLAQGKHDAAHKQLLAASRANAWDVEARRKLADLDFDRWELHQARTDLEQVLKTAPQDRRARFSLIRVLTALREYQLAERQLEELGKARGREDQGALALARGRLALRRGNVESGDIQRALRELNKAIRLRPDDLEPWILLVKAQLYDSVAFSIQGARRVAREMNDRLGRSPESLAAIGRVEWSEGNLKTAVRHLRQAVRMLGEQPRPPRIEAEIRVLLGRVYSDVGRLNDALAQYDDAERSCTKCPDPQHRKALALDEKGRGQDAIALLRKAMDLDPNNPELYQALGMVYENNSRPDDAIKMYTRYLKFSPPKELAREAQKAINNLR